MEEKYQVKLSVFVDSLDYCSDVESDGYYVIQGTNEVVPYGEDLSEEYLQEDALWDYLQSRTSIQLPTSRDLTEYAPDWNKDIVYQYIDEMIADAKQKKLLTKAYQSRFGNSITPAFPGSSKFRAEPGKLGRMNEFNQYVLKKYEAHQLEFIKKWCKENNVEIITE